MKYDRIPNYPGLNSQATEERPYIEIAYDAGDDLVARVRFEPRVDKPAIETNTELVSKDPVVFASGSLVDAEGQVLRIDGKGFVREASSHRMLAGNASANMDEWLDWIAKNIIIDDLVNAWQNMTSFSSMFPVQVGQ